MAKYGKKAQSKVRRAQTDTALHMIRLLVSPFGAIMLCGTIVLAWLFPLSRKKYTRIQKLLEQRRARPAG